MSSVAVVKLARAVSELTQIRRGSRQAPRLEGRLLEALIYRPYTIRQLSERLGVPRRAIRLELSMMALAGDVVMRPDETWRATDLRPIG